MLTRFALILTPLIILTSCSGGAGGSTSASSSAEKLIPLPNAYCGESDCISSNRRSNTIQPLAAGDKLSYLEDEYNNTLQVITKIRTGLNTLNSIASDAGHTNCSDIPASGTITSSGITFEFKAPSLAVNFGAGQINMEKKILLSTAGLPYLDVHINCGGSSTVKTVHVLYNPSSGEEYEAIYKIDSASNFNFFQSAAIYTESNISTKSMAQFEASSTTFKFSGVSEYTDNSLMTNNVQYQSVVAKTDSTDSNNLEYISNPSTAAPNNGTTDTLSAFGVYAHINTERVCMIDYASSSPTFSIVDSDCHTSGASALTPDGQNDDYFVLSITSGSPWSTQFAHDLDIVNITDVN